jgi:hypothetical protein
LKIREEILQVGEVSFSFRESFSDRFLLSHLKLQWIYFYALVCVNT